MAFDFPAAPTTGDKFTDAVSGTEYVWTGDVWDLASGGDLSDFVLKEGDTMTGELVMTGATSVTQISINGPNGRVLSFNPSGSPHSGLIEFWDPANPATRTGYMGYGDSSGLNLNAEGGRRWKVDGGITLQSSNLQFGSVAVTSPQDLSRHLALYSTTFGFCITGSTINYNSSNYHQFYGGTTNLLTLGTGAIELRIATNLRAATYSYGGINLQSGSYLKVPEGTGIRFHVNDAIICSTDNKAIRYGVAENSWHIFKVGADTEFNINSGGAGLLSLAPVATDLGVAPDSDGTVNIAKAMIAMLAKIKQLEAEVKTLKGRR